METFLPFFPSVGVGTAGELVLQRESSSIESRPVADADRTFEGSSFSFFLSLNSTIEIHLSLAPLLPLKVFFPFLTLRELL